MTGDGRAEILFLQSVIPEAAINNSNKRILSPLLSRTEVEPGKVEVSDNATGDRQGKSVSTSQGTTNSSEDDGRINPTPRAQTEGGCKSKITPTGSGSGKPVAAGVEGGASETHNASASHVENMEEADVVPGGPESALKGPRDERESAGTSASPTRTPSPRYNRLNEELACNKCGTSNFTSRKEEGLPIVAKYTMELYCMECFQKIPLSSIERAKHFCRLIDFEPGSHNEATLTPRKNLGARLEVDYSRSSGTRTPTRSSSVEQEEEEVVEDAHICQEQRSKKQIRDRRLTKRTNLMTPQEQKSRSMILLEEVNLDPDLFWFSHCVNPALECDVVRTPPGPFNPGAETKLEVKEDAHKKTVFNEAHGQAQASCNSDFSTQQQHFLHMEVEAKPTSLKRKREDSPENSPCLCLECPRCRIPVRESAQAQDRKPRAPVLKRVPYPRTICDHTSLTRNNKSISNNINVHLAYERRHLVCMQCDKCDFFVSLPTQKIAALPQHLLPPRQYSTEATSAPDERLVERGDHPYIIVGRTVEHHDSHTSAAANKNNNNNKNYCMLYEKVRVHRSRYCSGCAIDPQRGPRPIVGLCYSSRSQKNLHFCERCFLRCVQPSARMQYFVYGEDASYEIKAAYGHGHHVGDEENEKPRCPFCSCADPKIVRAPRKKLSFPRVEVELGYQVPRICMDCNKNWFAKAEDWSLCSDEYRENWQGVVFYFPTKKMGCLVPAACLPQGRQDALRNVAKIDGYGDKLDREASRFA
ncbi:unnamed protein product [Amoebophrya sp. A25]|nr:unnamed protein product [Amoebophrya sp. A25]|eukprot:GSA25T00001282001.1